MTDYRYIFGSLRTEEIIAEIPLYGTYMDLELNVGGRFDGSFSLDMTGISNRTLLDATIPGRCFVICERNGIPIWGGFVWSRTYQSQSKDVQLYAQSFEYYPRYQLIRSDLTQTDEQLTLFKNLWTHMQSVNGRNLNINVPTVTFATVITKQIEVATTDFKFYDEVMSSIADSEDGFDWTIDITKSDNYYIKTLRMGYPALGSLDPQGLTFDYPGSILNYYATEGMTDAGTNVYTLGAGEGSGMIFTQVIHQDLIDAGSPRWDVIASRKDISDPFTLDSFATIEAKIRRPPMLVIKPSMKSNRQPEFGSFGLGDACNLNIRDPRFPEGFIFPTRIAKWTLQPQSASNTDEFTVLFAGDED